MDGGVDTSFRYPSLKDLVMTDKEQGESIDITLKRLNLFEASINKLTGYFDGSEGLWVRIVRIETELKNLSETKLKNISDDMSRNMATKRDIDRLKIWILGGVLATIVGIVSAFMYLMRPVLQDMIQALIKAGGSTT